MHEREVDLRRVQINEMREKITSTLRTYKTSLAEKNKIIAQKGKEVKKENEYMFQLQKMSIDEYNKNICNTIKSQEKSYQEKKKRDEVERKLKLKAELERKIMEESKKKIVCDVTIKYIKK